jgi:predicted phage terminase large subunit-like protein
MNEYRAYFHQLSIDQKIAFIKKLSPSAVKKFRYETDIMLRDKQIVPKDYAGRYYIALAGRGWGKTKMGAHWIKTKVYEQTSKKAKLAIVAPNYKDLEEVMVPAILDEFPPEHKPTYVAGNKAKIVCHNGVEILCFTSEQEIRGGNFVAVWCDELAKWCSSIPEKAQERFEVLNYACRKGKAQFLITTTPKPWEMFFKWEERFNKGDKNVHIVTGTMNDNEFLSESAKQALYDEYSGTRSGRQELEGILLREVEGALWTYDIIKETRVPRDPAEQILNLPLFAKDRLNNPLEWLIKIVVAIDPAGSTSAQSDETGIMVCGLSNKGHAYVLSDASGRYTPHQWSTKAVELYKLYKANCVVVEKNFGGDMVSHTLKTVDPHLPIKVNTASKGKSVRAEPIAAKYTAKMVHHVGEFKKLEQQMTTFNGDGTKHDDKVDALVWALDELMIQSAYVNRTFINLPNFG